MNTIKELADAYACLRAMERRNRARKRSNRDIDVLLAVWASQFDAFVTTTQALDRAPYIKLNTT